MNARIFGFLGVLAALLILPLAARADLVQGGALSVTPGHAAVWVYNGILGDAGGSANPQITDFGISAPGMPFCIYDVAPAAGGSPPTGAFHQLCLGALTTIGGQTGGFLSYNAYGGAATEGMYLDLNGTVYSFLGSQAANVIGPTSPIPVSGNAVEWNGSLTVKDAGGPPALQVTTIAALKALPLTGLPAGFIVGVAAYSSTQPMPSDAYSLQTSGCSISGGDGFSQIPSNTSGNCWLIGAQKSYDARQAGVYVGGTDPNSNNGTQLQNAINYIEGFGGELTLGGQTIGYSGALTINDPMTFSGPGTLNSLSGSGFSAGGTQFESRTYWLNTGSVSVTNAVSAANANWTGALPVGMINFGSNATAANVIQNMTIDCELEANCSGIVSNGNNVAMQNLTVDEYVLWGIVGFAHMGNTGNLTIFQDASVSNWTGVGLGCINNAVTDDSIIGPQLYIHATGIGAVVGCGDFKFFGSHIFPASVGPSNWNAMVFNSDNGVAAIVNNTFDNSRVVWQRASGTTHIGQLQMKDNVWESGNGGTVDANLVIQCMGPTQCGEDSQLAANIAFTDPIPTSFNDLYLSAYGAVALEDQYGNQNEDAWTNFIQQLTGPGMNSCFYACTNQPYPNITPQGGQFTFTGNVSNGSFQISAASILPVQGTTLTVTGCGASVSGGQITDISYTQDRIWYAGTTTGTGTGCAVSVGSLSLTGTIAVAADNTIGSLNLEPFGLYEEISDSASCIPAHSWVSGQNEHTGIVVFRNLTPTAATCSQSGDTITVTPYHYYPAPSDSSSLLVANTSVSTTFYLRDDNPRGWFANITPRDGTGSVLLTPIGSASINGGTTSETLIDNSYAVDRLWSAAMSPSKYSIVNGAVAVSLGPASLTGGGSGIAFSPANPINTTGFGVNVGTSSGSNFTVHFTQFAPNGWACSGSNTTTPADNIVQTAYGNQTAQLSNYASGTLTNFANNAVVIASCSPF